MSALDAEKARRRIGERLSGLRRRSRAAAPERAVVELDQTAVGRLSRMDAIQRQAMAGAEEARRQTEIMRLEQALKRIEEGEYGWCASCGEKIPEGRMEIDPAATLCVRCAAGGN